MLVLLITLKTFQISRQYSIHFVSSQITFGLGSKDCKTILVWLNFYNYTTALLVFWSIFDEIIDSSLSFDLL